MYWITSSPLVLEIDVDVRRFVAFARQEAFEQQLAARRVHLGDAEAEADGGIRRRAAALAEDLLRLRPADDVVDGQEVVLVAQLGDQREFVRDLRLHRRRRALRPARARAGFGQGEQVLRGGHAGRHQFFRVFVAQFVERESAACGDVCALFEQRRRVEPVQFMQRAQVALAIGLQARAELLHRRVQADGSEHVQQRLARAFVHQCLAGGAHRQLQVQGERVQREVAARVVAVAQGGEGEP
jgi:hypothetical protein